MEKVFADINARAEKARSPLSTLAKAIFGGKPAATVAGEHIGLVLTSLILPATQAATSARYRADAMLNLTRLSFGLAAYRKDHGEYPDKLDALVPKYFDALPKDPFTGEQLRYKKKGGGFLAYSVGADQEDDEGRGPLSGDAAGDDFAIVTPDLQP